MKSTVHVTVPPIGGGAARALLALSIRRVSTVSSKPYSFPGGAGNAENPHLSGVFF